MNIRCFNRHVSFPTQQHLRPIPLPSPMESHLWYVVPDEVKGSSLLNRYMEILSPSEKQSVLSLSEDGHKKRALLARALVRLTIARYRTIQVSMCQCVIDCSFTSLNRAYIVLDQTNSYVDSRSLQFKKNMYGKPEVDWQHTPDGSQPSLHFNISHTSSLIACGITTYSPIGIDLEEKTRKTKNNVLSFARRFFCMHEVEYLAKITDPEVQRLEFLKLWTLKEAYVKALGRGFSAAPFNTFRIHIETPTDEISNIPEDDESKVSAITVNSTHSSHKWQFALLELADTHYAAVCTENNSGSIEDNKESPLSLRVWKTIPLLEDICMSGSGSVITIGGYVKQLR